MAEEPVTLAGGRYQLVRQVGAGGMGDVYEGIDRETRRRVAIKRLHMRHVASADLTTRFGREILATAQIASRHVVGIHDAGVDDDGEPFMVMDFLVGEDVGDLADRLRVLPVELALRLVAQTCDGLIAAHAVGIVHRDIKPSNLFLVAPTASSMRIIKILDFGIARIRRASPALDPMTELTRTGAIVGSPLYMAPEQLRGAKSLDHRADVWSLGVVLYRLLCGTVPHPRDSFGDLLVAVCSEPAPPLRDRAPWVPDDVARLVHAALQIDVDARISSAQAFADELARLLPEGAAITDAMIVAHAPPSNSTARGPTVQGAVATPIGNGSVELATPTPAPMSVARPVVVPMRTEPERFVRRVRPGFVLALVATAALAVVAVRKLRARAEEAGQVLAPAGERLDLPAALADSEAGHWFAKVRSHCNAVELQSVIVDTPPPAGKSGVAYLAACAALAGDLDRARKQIDALDVEDRALASWPMFAVAHPLADRRNGDLGAANIMRLVLLYWPENYLALYHVGITEFIIGDPSASRHLDEFLRLYPKHDPFRNTATVLQSELAHPSPEDCSRVVVVDPEGHTIRQPRCN